MRVTQLPCTSKAAALAWIREHKLTGLGILQLCHDDFCEVLTSGCESDCAPPCCPDIYLIEPFAVSPAEAKTVLN
jgi:hypothetical protein